MRRGQLLMAGILLLNLPALRGQHLLVDRGLQRPDGMAAEPDGGFLADRFTIGAKGEVWVIDRLRIWVRAAKDGGKIGDRLESVALFGGLEAAPAKPGELECDCHNLVALESAALREGSDIAEGSKVRISRLEPAVWQLDFEDLNWSVPGGVAIQFGVSGRRRADAGAAKWSVYTVPAEAPHEIKLFDERGKLAGPYGKAGKDPAAGLAVQAWGHLPVAIDIEARAELLQVKLAAAEALRVDPASLQFGPRGAAPVALHAEGTSLLMTFRAADTGIQPGDLNACLSGRRRDGVPFAGCDLLRKPARR